MLLGVRSEKAKRFLLLRCEQCSDDFERSYGRQQELMPHHFCSRACSQAAHGRGGVLFLSMEATLRSRLGSNFRKVISAKAHASMTPEKKKLSREKAHATVLQRYGVRTAVEIPHVRKKCMENGTVPDVIARRKQTMVERHGVQCMLDLPEVRAKGQTLKAWKKRHQTMRKNGTYRASHAEDKCFKLLVDRFQTVERWKRVNVWPIDFYIPCIDTYVQFDGEHWHGLDRPIDEIRTSAVHHDRVIYAKWCNDRRQEAWFIERGLKLIRITDRQMACGDLPDELK